MNLIAAVDTNWAIGNRGQLLVRIPEDQRFFRSQTLNKVVILGRKTMDTFPGGRPLPQRKNIVLSTNRSYTVKDAVVVHNIDEAIKEADGFVSEDIYIIGGSEIYKQFLPMCDTAYITKVNYRYQADAYFPNLDKDEEWECVSESDEQTCYDMEYRMCRYIRRK